MPDFQCIIWKVEHGSAAFLRTSNNRTIMFDAGCSDDFSPAKYLNQKYGLNSTANRLDKIIISHPDRDHIQDLPNVYSLIYPKILFRNPSIPNKIIYPSGTNNIQEPLKTFKIMNDEYCHELSDYDKNEPISNWGDVLIETFNCTPDHIKDCPEGKLKNNLSILSYVRYKETEVVFPGDLEPYGWWALLNNTKIIQYVGKAKCRILIAPHHGRESGIRYQDNEGKKIYDAFLKIIRPNLVIMSDKWGSEATDTEAYKESCEGFLVHCKSINDFEQKKIITTKTNKFVLIQILQGFDIPLVKIE